MAKNKGAKIDLGTGSINKLIVTYALPAIIALTVNSLNVTIDSMYLARLGGDAGTLAVAAVGLVNPILQILTGVGLAIALGGPMQVSMRMGKGDAESRSKINSYVGSSISLALIIGIIITALMGFYGKTVLGVLGASEATMPYAWMYLSNILFALTFHMLANVTSGFVNTFEMPGIRMIGLLIQAGVNIILDPILIFTLDKGIEGAAIATGISYVVSTTWFVCFLIPKMRGYNFKFSDLLPRLKPIGGVLKLGLAILLAYLTEALLSACFTSQTAKFGDEYVTLFSSFTLLIGILQFFLAGMSQGPTPIFAYNYGAQKYGRLKQLLKRTVLITAIYSVSVWALLMLFPKAFMSIMITDEALLTQTQYLQMFFGGFFMFNFITMVQSIMASMNNWHYGVILMFVRKILVIIPLIFILQKPFGVDGIFYAEFIGDIVGGVIGAILIFMQIKKVGKMETRLQANSAA